MSKERANYKALEMKKAAEKEAAMKKAEEQEIARKKEMENKIKKGIEALKYTIKNDGKRFQEILQLYVASYGHDSNFFLSLLSPFRKAALFIEYIWVYFSNHKLLDLKNFILKG